MNEKPRRALAVLGACAIFGSMLVVSATSSPGRAFAGSGNEPDNTYVQPTQAAMTTGATVTAGPAATTLAKSLMTPTLKATPPAAECNTTGQCP